MKKLVMIILLLAANSNAAIQFANVYQQTQFESMPATPDVVQIGEDLVTNPSPEQCWEYQLSQGIRRVTDIQSIRDGWAVTQWTINDTDGTNCTISITAEYNIAERAAEEAAAEAARQAELARLAILQSHIDDLMQNRNAPDWANLDGQHGIALPQLPQPCPSEVGPIFGTPNASQTASYYWRNGWRKIVTNATPDDGYRATGYSVVELDYATCNTLITGQTNIALEAAEIAQAQAAAAQAAYIADLQANASRYAYENAYIMLCDTLRGDQQHTLIDGLEFAQRIMALKTASPADYDKMRDAFNFIKSQLDPIDLQWGKTAQYRDVPSLVAAAQQMIGLLQ